MTITLNGIVHGRTIELEADPGIPDGRAVRVTLLATTPEERADAMRRAFGGWAAEGEELDRFLAETRAARKQDRKPIE